MKALSLQQMEEVNGGRGAACWYSIGMVALSAAAMVASAATVVGAGLGIAGLYGSIIGVGLSC